MSPLHGRLVIGCLLMAQVSGSLLAAWAFGQLAGGAFLMGGSVIALAEAILFNPRIDGWLARRFP